MIEPYTAVGLVTTVRGVRRRSQIRRNLDHIADVMAAAAWLSSLDLPVRLVAIPEGALQGFTDEVFDMDHHAYAEKVAIDVPGEETAFLGELARHWKVFIMGQAKARNEHFPGMFFNLGFVIDPSGEVILRHHKVATLYPVEHSVTPHDVWDRWVEIYGRGLDAFYPVVDTEIGRLGVMMANEGSYPENARGLAMNGAEVVYRASYPHPHTGNEFFEIQNRARALDNNLYVLAPNLATYYLEQDSELPVDTFGGSSMIVDYKGRVVGRHSYGAGSSYVAGTVDIQALRHFRASAQWDNWLKDLRTEQYQLIYERPIYPKNLYLDRSPYKHEEFRREVILERVKSMHEQGIWAPPGTGEQTG
jgi:predicted amidohydrolase